MRSALMRGNPMWEMRKLREYEDRCRFAVTHRPLGPAFYHQHAGFLSAKCYQFLFEAV